MRPGTVGLSTALLFTVFLASCEAQRVEYFAISIIAGTDLETPAHEAVPDAIRPLANYYRDSTCNHRIFVPVVAIRRVDLNPERVDSVTDPLSALNRWRRSVKLLPASHVIADYDQGWQKLPMPSIVSTKGGHFVDVSTMREKYPLAELPVIDDSLSSRAKSLRSRIRERLCSASSPAFAIIFYRK
jgi:hypothetical protein